MMKKIVIGILSLILSALLMFSIPLINYFLNYDENSDVKVRKTEISIKKIIKPDVPKKQKKATSRPKRSKPVNRSVKSGPRFAMDLNVAGVGEGVGVSLDLVKSKSGGGGLGGDVDEKPQTKGRTNLQAPQAILDAEQNAYLLVSFCVDTQGKAFDIKIVEERPSGKGLGEAGREALMKTDFDPALKDNRPVPFCGMEQPFEIKFRD